MTTTHLFSTPKMTRLALLALFSGLLTFGCTRETPTPAQEDAPTSSLSGLVTYGQGDCMPAIDESKRVYQPYSGELYFISKAAVDQLGAGGWEQLKRTSQHYAIRNGELRVALPADTYVVMPAALYVYTAANTVVLTDGQSASQDFKFWKCLVY
jgi:hypothetical protein